MRHDHELLHINARIRMAAAVEHIHHRHRQHIRVAIEITVQRHAVRRGGRISGGERHAEHRVGAELRLVLGAVKRDQRVIDRGLIRGVGALEPGRDRTVDVGDGAQNALAAVTLGIAVAQFQSLMRSRRGARRHRRAAKRSVFESNIDFDGRIAAAVDNFARVNMIYLGHRSWPETLSPRLILREVQ